MKRVVQFSIFGLTVLLAPSLAQAQSACARALMMAGPDISGPGEVRQKRILERECEIERADDRNRQILAQKRIEARQAWASVRAEIKTCINGKLEPDGRNIEQLIGLGIAPSDDAIATYRRECFGLPANGQDTGFRAPAASSAPNALAQRPESDGVPRAQGQSDLLRGEGSEGHSYRPMNAPPGTIIVNGGGGGSVIVMPGGGTPRSVNLLEAAVNPLTGTKRLWETFKDEGGLAVYTDFHGLKIDKAAVDLQEDRVHTTRLQVPAATPPRKLREALNTACQGDERSWLVATDHRGTRGELQTPMLTCRYETDDGASDYQVSIIRRK
jgi:hypothetical protein